MNSETDKPDFAKEYTEAGALCRSYESHSRTAVALFVPFATGTIAFVFGLSKSPAGNVLLCSLGVIFSVATLVVIYRTREFNHIANKRAAELEEQLGFSLYKQLNRRFKGSMLPGIKITYMLVVGSFLIAFLISLGWAICTWSQP